MKPCPLLTQLLRMYLMLNLSATIILEYCDYKTSEKAENKN